MRQAGKPGDRLLRRRPSSRSVRVRLTALYGGLFLLSGAALLTITYLLVRGADTPTFKPAPPSSHHLLQRLAPAPRVLAVSGSDLAYATRLLSHQHRLDVHQLLEESGIALAVMVGSFTGKSATVADFGGAASTDCVAGFGRATNAASPA